MSNTGSVVLYLDWLTHEAGYLDVRLLPDGRWAAIRPLIYTHAIIAGRVGDFTGYDDRWCYYTYATAKAALDAWDGTGEPEGWHRHPASGRRRPAGNAEAEHVQW